MTPLEQAQERMNEPTILTAAQGRSDKITQRLRDAKINAMAVALQDEKSYTGKVIWLKQILKTISDATSGIVPCKDGCSHCCKMAVNITLQEAEELAKASGQAMTMPTWTDPDEYKKKQLEEIERFEGVDCPFLVNDRCSVYKVRPIPCQLHYSVDRDNLLCRIIPKAHIRAPSLDTRQVALLAALTYERPLEVRLADIREFFPT